MDVVHAFHIRQAGELAPRQPQPSNPGGVPSKQYMRRVSRQLPGPDLSINTDTAKRQQRVGLVPMEIQDDAGGGEPRPMSRAESLRNMSSCATLVSRSCRPTKSRMPTRFATPPAQATPKHQRAIDLRH